MYPPILLKKLTWRGITSNKYFSIQTELAAAKKNVKNDVHLLNIQLI